MNKHPNGTTVKLTGSFQDADSRAYIDPGTVTLKVKDPAGTIVSYTFAAGTVTKDATGKYSKSLTFSTAGEWYYRWEGTANADGLGAGADESKLQVEATVF